MKRRIEVKVDGSHLTKDSATAGVQHEANSTLLRIKFDESWDGMAKSVTWWNANGLNPVVRVLTADMLEDINTNTRVYLCPIPGEPLEVAGMCTLVIDGFLDGKRQRSVSDQLKVTAAPYAAYAGSAADPTPTQAEQLQVQIDTLMQDIRDEVVKAVTSAQSAKDSAESAGYMATNAAESVGYVAADAEAAKAAATKATSEANRAKAEADRAAGAAGGEFVVKTGDTMTGDLTISKGIPGVILTVPNSESHAEIKKNASSTADFGTNINDIESAGNYTQLLICHKDRAAQLKVFENGRNTGAYDIYHEGFKPTAADVGAPTIAQMNEAIAAKSTPDVSGQISTHNASAEAHSDIREAIIGRVPKSGGTMTGNLTVEKSGIRHIFSVNTSSNVAYQQYNDTARNVAANIGLSDSQLYYQVTKDMSTWSKYPILHTGNKDQIFTYGTEDLVDGVSALETGKLYFVYK